MYDIPEDFDPSVFVGTTLQLISFSFNTIHFRFETPMLTHHLVSVFQAVSYRKPGGDFSGVKVRDRSSDLMELLELSVVACTIGDTEGVRDILNLEFDGQYALRFGGQRDGYEEYSVQIGDREIYV
jgi:hypothetical protein